MLRSFVLVLVSTLCWGMSGTQALSGDVVCVAPEAATTPRAMLGVFKYHKEATIEMGRRRGVPLPMFDQNDNTSVTQYIQRYTYDREGSAFMIFASDEAHVCSYLFLRGRDVPLYQRQAITGTQIRLASGNLRRDILCRHVDNTRAPRLKRNDSIIPWFVDATDPDLQCLDGSNNLQHIKPLSNIFFPPEFQDALRPVKHLSVLPIRSLSAVPVAILEPFGDGRLAVESFSMNFIAFFPDIRKGPSRALKTFSTPLIVGDPEASSDQEYSFVPLPGALREAEQLHKVVGGKLLKKTEAQIGAFVHAAQEADLIYVAAHGLSDIHESLDNSFIAMADGRLTARRVQALKLKGRPLVVLSACQTGLGTVVEAGIIGIGRAFQKAGARNTIMSLWNVFDEPTLFMMTEFRKHLTERHPAEALRYAMLAGRARYKDPVYWAGFVAFGN